jgi:Uma2 family endonuclease
MTVQLPISTSSQRAKLSAADFWLLADAGAFKDFVKTELIEGEIRVVNAVHSRHARAHAALTVELGIAMRAIGSPLILLATPSTALSDDSIPEPDIAIASRAEDKAIAGKDLLLAIEISDTTLAEDLGAKQRLYAHHSIPEYWVVDVDSKIIHQMWAPDGEDYVKRRQVLFGEALSAATLATAIETGSLILTG